MDGLTAAHSNNVCHRDIKPANVFLTGPGDSPDTHCKIGDFGIATAVAYTEQTIHGHAGTRPYMAPGELFVVYDVVVLIY